MFYKNAILAIWLDYTTKYLIEQDINLIEMIDAHDIDGEQFLDKPDL